MSSESSAAKWLAGCAIAGVLSLLLCGGGVVLLVYWGANKFGEIAQQFGTELQQQLAELQFAEAWRPPAGPELPFPARFGAWVRADQDAAAVIPELGIDRDGWHAVYESAGSTVNVYAYRVPASEQARLFDEAAAAIDAVDYSSRSLMRKDYGTLNRLGFSYSPPERHGRMWWSQDWLFVFVTPSADVELESFEREFLLAVQTPESPASIPDGVERPSEPIPVDPDSPSDAPADAGPVPSESPAAEGAAPQELPMETRAESPRS